MTQFQTRTVRREPFEFERQGPVVRRQAPQKPDFTIGNNQTRIISRSIDNQSNISTHTEKREKGRPITTFFLIDLFGTSDFSSIKELDVSSKKLNGADSQVLKTLTSVVKADCSDNQLPLEPFAIMSSLEELDLSCNSIRQFDYKQSEALTGDERAWKNLHTLNLSYNYCGNALNDIQRIPRLTTLNLSHNSLKMLPSTLLHFTCLATLDLSGNFLNTDNAFFSLAKIQSLQTLILDDNSIMRIPRFQFGFESLSKISLKQNKLQTVDDISSLVDLEQLQDVDVSDNPICLNRKNLSSAKQLFAQANVTLRTEKPAPPPKQTLPPTMRTVQFDPLTLPTFTKAHITALNRKRQSANDGVATRSLDSLHVSDESPKKEVTNAQVGDSFFMTAFGSKAEEDVNEIDSSQLPDEPEEEINVNSIWAEVPVVQLERRVVLNPKHRSDFNNAFHKLEFLVAHPDLRLKPRESPSTAAEEPTVEEQPEAPPPEPKPIGMRKKKNVATKLAARTEYTKTEIQQMLQGMEERLSTVERDLQVADESGQSAVDIALDQRNFASLHKQYETIRAELINTLNA